MKRAIAFLPVIATIIAGCSAASNDEPTARAESKVVEGAKLASIHGEEWGRCWFAPTPSVAESLDMYCRHAAPDPSWGWKIDLMYVAPVHGAYAYGLVGDNAPIPATETAPVLTARVTRSSFPMDLWFSPQVFMFDTTNSVDGFDFRSDPFGDFDLTSKVLAPTTYTEAAPLVFTEPFDQWPVFVANLGSRFYELSAAPYDVSIAPYTVAKRNAMTVTLGVPRQGGGSRLVRIPAPPSGKLEATMTEYESGNPVALRTLPAVIDGPGVYIVDDNGFRGATADEAAQLAPDLKPR